MCSSVASATVVVGGMQRDVRRAQTITSTTRSKRRRRQQQRDGGRCVLLSSSWPLEFGSEVGDSSILIDCLGRKPRKFVAPRLLLPVALQGCQKVWNSGGAPNNPHLKKWWSIMLSNHQKVVEHVPPGLTYSNTPISSEINFLGINHIAPAISINHSARS